MKTATTSKLHHKNKNEAS